MKTDERVITAFVVANFLLGSVWLLFVLLLFASLAICFGWAPGVPVPPSDELFFLVPGVLGMLALYIPGVVAFFVAAVGLKRRARWGLYWHWAAALLAAVSCYGGIYTIIALWFATRPGFADASRKKRSQGLHTGLGELLG